MQNPFRERLTHSSLYLQNEDSEKFEILYAGLKFCSLVKSGNIFQIWNETSAKGKKYVLEWTIIYDTGSTSFANINSNSQGPE